MKQEILVDEILEWMMIRTVPHHMHERGVFFFSYYQLSTMVAHELITG